MRLTGFRVAGPRQHDPPQDLQPLTIGANPHTRDQILDNSRPLDGAFEVQMRPGACPDCDRFHGHAAATHLGRLFVKQDRVAAVPVNDFPVSVG